jgi:hypothetical protein
MAFDLKNSNDSSCGISGVRVFGMYSVVGSISSVKGDLTDCIKNEYKMSIKTISHNCLLPHC